MTSQAEDSSNGEKIIAPPSSMDEAERGGVSLPGKRGTGLSLFGHKRQSFLQPDNSPTPGKVAISLTPRPRGLGRTASSNSVLPVKPSSAPILIKSQVTPLSLAVTNGEREMANSLMDSLENENMLGAAGLTIQDASGNGLLQIAALYGHLDILIDLLDRGMNINSVDRNHGTALQAAIYMGQKEIWHELLTWNRQKTEAMESSNDATNDKIKVNTKGGYFGCALQVAAYKANDELVKELLEQHQADANISGGKYGSPLQAAVRTGRMAVVKHVIPKSNVNLKGGKYGSALQAVARGPYRTRMRLPEISRGQVLKRSAQIAPGQYVDREQSEARDADYLEVAKTLFKHRAQMEGRGGILDNPINAAACSGSKDMLQLILENFEKRSPEWDEPKSVVLTKALLTAITQAPENHEILTQLLVDRGAMVQYPTSEALQSLPLEAAATKGRLGVVNYLLKVKDTYGNFADTLAESGIHGTALRAAIATSKPEKEEVVECLINSIAEQWEVKARSPVSPISPFDRENIRPSHDPIIRTTGTEKLNWTYWDAEYGNLLQLATFSGLRKTVELLLKYGADSNVRDTSQRTPLHIAAWFGFPQIVRLLLDNDADANAKDEWGATPLDQAEESLDRNGHPGATEKDLQEIIQTLRGNMGENDGEKPGKEFRGPKRSTNAPEAPLKGAKPVFAMPFWIPGVGFHATVVDIWEHEEPESVWQECLLLKKPRIEEILYPPPKPKDLKTPRIEVPYPPPNPKDNSGEVKKKLRWIHIPTNNMTWAEMIITSLCRDKGMPTYKTLWGNDAFFTSADLSPHARFIAPQCGRLAQDGPGTQNTQPGSNPLFMAMPYIHWEAYRAQKGVSRMIERVKDELLKTNPTPSDKLPLWRSEKGANAHAPGLQITDATGQIVPEEPRTSNLDNINLDNPEAEEDYFEMLRRYLFKRRPVHLRRTLDQYYYSYLADTNDRDGDQVVMRQFNEDRKRLKLKADGRYKELLETKVTLQAEVKEPDLVAELVNEELFEIQQRTAPTPKATLWHRVLRKFHAPKQKKKLKDVENKILKIDQKMYYDDNSPVLMIDQLWLWVIDDETIVTCFPHRQYDRNTEDLDASDKTDILKTIVSYLHSSRRPEIKTAQELAELIISQCVAVLHKADMIPELDFLKKYSVQSNKWADQVMHMLSLFVTDFEKFMIWIKEQPAESEESIRKFESIFSVTEQTRLLRNIQDIKDELGMLQAVFEDQVQVLTATSEQFERGDYKCEYGCRQDSTHLPESIRCPHGSNSLVDQSFKHLKHVKRMQVQADQAYGTLKDLLDLKQQQAYVLEARVSRNEAISSGVQSKTIMVFTIVTIIFLPLTFVTTVFTLPIAEFQRVVLPEGSDFPATAFLRKSYISKYIIGITFAVAVPLILAAFEIQYVINGWKLLRLKMAKRKIEKKRRLMTPENDGIPEFLKSKQEY